MKQIFTTSSEAETISVAGLFAKGLERGDVIALYGELGAGKTQFVKGVSQTFSVQENVTSPTFVILNRYAGEDPQGEELLVYHLDLYRVKSLEEIYDIGYEEFFYGNGICLIEWADLLGDLLPANRYDVTLKHGATEYQRQIEIDRKISEGLRKPTVHS
ncbi:MAG: tRNA (adenosine(37)-N6)-threonylcarbamoyltransferase complex ATPase subunit type 1 TsaE [Ignavibacteriales bacterium]|nr:tRNA (adenosine(37)-N6)-threonylcarbamoyltransferase complex ATPase subunit type 1 TsaE [Ignavibacteriales bacterium]MBI3789244.1 tRNA (adenosine(37)-N6)-threonylcarbamoyltransferase complex ATPase subunit type 1 TsaE [Ignavibacteriales bacterium]